MVEAWARRLKSDAIEAYSAGVETHGLNPLALKAMAEAGVDISGNKPKLVDELMDTESDFVVTVCHNAHESCPVFPGHAKVVHRVFDNPPRLTRQASTEEGALTHHRRIRAEIRAFVKGLPESLTRSKEEK